MSFKIRKLLSSSMLCTISGFVVCIGVITYAGCGFKCHVLCAMKWESAGQTKALQAAGSVRGRSPVFLL